MFDTGGARRCRCQALKVQGWIWRDTTQEERDAALLEQAGCGTSGPTSGLVGYVDGEPAGWVAVEPRENYPRIWARQKSWMRMMQISRASGRSPASWCVKASIDGTDVRAHRRHRPRQAGRRSRPRGLPTRASTREDRDLDGMVGLLQVFLDAGYEVEASPTLRRRVVRHRLRRLVLTVGLGTPEVARERG